MQFDPLYKHKKVQGDWRPAPRKKRKLTLLPYRKYIHSKGTMVRVKVQPEAPIQCVVMRWMDGEPNAIPCAYIKSEKLLIWADSGIGYVFNSRSEAKHAIWHTCQKLGIPGGHVDFMIVNKE